MSKVLWNNIYSQIVKFLVEGSFFEKDAFSGAGTLFGCGNNGGGGGENNFKTSDILAR